MLSAERPKKIQRVLYVALLLNVLVAFSKLLYGLLTNTLSMIADGFHSMTDMLSSVMGLISIRFASRPSDEDHHYGHQKYETMAALGIALFIALTAWEILKKAITRLISPELSRFYFSGFVIMAATVAANLILAAYEKRKARQYSSAILEADAYHTSSDVWVSLSVFVSLLAIRWKLLWMDAAISFLIAAYLAYIAFRLARENGLILSDASFIHPNDIQTLVQGIQGVQSCHRIRSRGRVGQAFIDLHVQVDPSIDTATSHELTHRIETRIRQEFPGVRDILIHTEPFPDRDRGP